MSNTNIVSTPLTGRGINAATFPPICPQVPSLSNVAATQNEDCLYAVVYAPVFRLRQPLPVFVWYVHCQAPVNITTGCMVARMSMALPLHLVSRVLVSPPKVASWLFHSIGT